MLDDVKYRLESNTYALVGKVIDLFDWSYRDFTSPRVILCIHIRKLRTLYVYSSIYLAQDFFLSSLK